MGFESIPEDREESYLCPCGGNITKYGHKWLRDNCDLEKPVIEKTKKKVIALSS